MTREEAIEVYHGLINTKIKEAFEFFAPELAESEDERIRKLLVWQVHRNIEDETNDLAQSVYDGIKGHDPDIEESIEDWKRCLAYLEKHKEQKPAEWSEEDEKMLNRIIETLSLPPIYDTKACAKMVSWLKSLHPRWKPSEEQMKILEKAVAFFKTEWTGTKIKEVLNLESLYEQLKSIQ